MSWIIWIIIAILLVILEVFTPSLFFFTCLAIGFLFAGAAAALDFGIWIQITAFSATSIVSVLFIRPILRKYLNKTDSKASNIDEIIGKDAVVIEKVSVDNQGLVKVMGEVWSAFSEAGEIEKSSTAEIVSVKGTRLIVRKK